MDPEEHEPKLFSLSEAERARRQVEPLLIEAQWKGAARWVRRWSMKVERHRQPNPDHGRHHDRLRCRRPHAFRLQPPRHKVKDALDQIHATGCVVKDLDSGLVDFPAVLKNEEVYLCWRLGEDRIRFYHRQDEGFSGRKPIDPEDTGPEHPIQ
jgi:hypothetical protein